MRYFLMSIDGATVAFVAVAATRARGVEEMIAQCLRDALSKDREALELAIPSVHELFLQRGDLHEQREQFGADSSGWYRAGAYICVLRFTASSVAFASVGQLIVCREVDGRCEPVVPVHNVGFEWAAGTIEDSQLRPFGSRENREILEQVLDPEFVAKFAGLSREEFVEAIAPVNTRAVGYFPSPKGLMTGEYCKVALQCSKGEIGDKKLLLYHPEPGEIFTPRNQQVLRRMRSLLDKVWPTGLSIHELRGGELRRGELLTISRNDVGEILLMSSGQRNNGD